MLKAINTIVANNNAEIQNLIEVIRSDDYDIADDELELRLSTLLASYRTLGVFTQPAPDPVVPNKALCSVPLPAFMEKVEDDDPDKEDKDHKKIREDAIGFFG